MTYTEDYSVLEFLNGKPPFNDHTWLSEVLARETDALTKALQVSGDENSEAFSSFIPVGKPDTYASDLEPSLKRKNSIACTSKQTKRRSRASKRSPATVINTDPANFREMVQAITGANLTKGHASIDPVRNVDPQRLHNRIHSGYLPTLDSMENVSVGPTEFYPSYSSMELMEGCGAFEFESLYDFSSTIDSRCVT